MDVPSLALPAFTGDTPPGSSRSANPFILPAGAKQFHFREIEDARRQEILASTRAMTLVQRTGLEQQPLPPLVSKGTIRHRRAVGMPPPPETPHTTRRMRMPEYIAQKQEVFLIELMIQRKRQEMASLDAERQAEEAAFLTAERVITDTSNEYKMASAQTEAAVARARKASEAATSRRMELQKQHKMLLQSVAIARSDISKNEDALERYRQYRDFLVNMTPEGRDPDEFYDGPERLIQQLDELERSNVFLVDEFESLSDCHEKRVENVETAIGRVDEAVADVQERAQGVAEVHELSEAISEDDVRASEQTNRELMYLTEIIARTHTNCFRVTGNLPALLMLTRIENALEDLYRKMKAIRPVFVEAKQRQKDEERMERQKEEASEKKAADQRLKYEQALERAQMPIKKRTGRPPLKRMLPITAKAVDPEKSLADQIERERIEALLYGEF
jgi:hypothetical protein